MKTLYKSNKSSPREWYSVKVENVRWDFFERLAFEMRNEVKL